MEEISPLPCPFCGNPRVGFMGNNQEHHPDCECYDWQASEYAVNCSAQGIASEGVSTARGCGATGGFAHTKREAIERWNRRFPSTVKSEP
jgi:hypothetical protein